MRTALFLLLFLGCNYCIIKKHEKTYSIGEENVKVGNLYFEYRDTDRRNPFEGDTIVVDTIIDNVVKYHKLHVDDKVRTSEINHFVYGVKIIHKK